MALEHDFFGVVDDDGVGGLRWDDTIELGDRAVEVVLVAAHADATETNALNAAAAMLQVLEGLDSRARDALIAQLSERESATTQYVDRRVDELGDDLAELLVHTSGDIAMDVLRSLQLVRITLHVDQAGDDEVFAEFEYAIDPDESDDVLTIGFDVRADVVAIDLGLGE